MLTDCSPIDLRKLSQAVGFGSNQKNLRDCSNWLAELSKTVRASSLLEGSSQQAKDEEPVVYCDPYGQWWTGRYIGELYFNNRRLLIEPRFGLDFVAQRIASHRFALVDLNAKEVSGGHWMLFLQALMWLAMFAKASRHTPPFVRQEHARISSQIRGTLDVRKTIKLRASGSEEVASTTSQRVLSNPATVCIARAYRVISGWFQGHDLTHRLPERAQITLSQVLEAVGRHEPLPSPQSLRKVRYTSLTRDYQPLVALSLRILAGKGIDHQTSEDQRSKGLLLDVAELWESYLLDVLAKAAPDSWSVIHGTEQSESRLLSCSEGKRSMGRLKPDFILRDNRGVTWVADAKYKRIGDAPWQSPKRDDLYQMSAYLSGFKEEFVSSATGALIYPDFGNTSDCEAVKGGLWRQADGAAMQFLAMPIELDLAVERMRFEFNRRISSPMARSITTAVSL